MTQSKLQQVQTQANHAAYFRLHNFYPMSLSKVVVSNHTLFLIEEYNKHVELLKASILIDADYTKDLITKQEQNNIDIENQ